MKFKEVLKKYLDKFKTPDYAKELVQADAFIEPCLPLLKLMPALGFLPIDFHSGTPEKGKPELRNRAFIRGIMTTSHAEAFVLHMAVYTDKTAIHIPIITYSNNDVLTIPVALETTSKKINVKNYYYLGITEEEYDDMYKLVDLSKKEDVIYLFCWDPTWNKNASSPDGLFSYMVSVLKHISKN
jgi:hypothetical protein